MWTDQSGIVDGLSVTGSGAKSYVNFHVSANKIKNGNAVIAVKNASGTIMWSWHLWFDHDDVLDVIPCTNLEGKIYKVTKQTLGLTYETWKQTAYDQPRTVRAKRGTARREEWCEAVRHYQHNPESWWQREKISLHSVPRFSQGCHAWY